MQKYIQPIRNILTAVLLGAVLFAFGSCVHDKTEPEAEQPMLRIYVYAPDSPLRTRANTDYVSAYAAEKAVHSLQIWVFEHESGALVGYLRPSETAVLNADGHDSYMLAVSEDFAQRKPDVDVYVLANCSAANCGQTYSSITTRDELDGALMANGGSAATDSYGLTALHSSVDGNEGLPMSGVLKEQPVYGESPVLRVGTSESLATVRLVRAVSKVRFVFAKAEEAEENIQFLSISLDGGVLPKAQYLFLDGPYTGSNFRISPLAERSDDDYEAAATLATGIGSIEKTVADPTVYSYALGQEPQEYEALIDEAVADKKLKQGGLFYLRESDRRLAGTIRYQIGENAPAEVRFSMADAGDFSRNHTWIVYAYYDSSDKLQIATIYVKLWDDADFDYSVYNW